MFGGLFRGKKKGTGGGSGMEMVPRETTVVAKPDGEWVFLCIFSMICLIFCFFMCYACICVCCILMIIII